MSIEDLFGSADDVTRRQFMRGAARGLLGLGALPLLDSTLTGGALYGATLQQAAKEATIALGPATARNVIYLYMAGGMSQLDTFDPKPESENQGPTEVIGTNVDGIQVSSHFSNLARHMDKIAVVNSMFSNQGAHQQGRYLLHTSYELRGTIKHPSLGAWLGRMGGKVNPTLPGHVAVGAPNDTASAGFFTSEFSPLPIGDATKGLNNSKRVEKVSDEAFHRRMDRLEKMNKSFRKKYGSGSTEGYDEMYAAAIRLMNSRDLNAFDITQEPDLLRDAYGRDRFGQGCLLARRLVEHDVRFVEVVLGGWDTHNENFEAMEDKCPTLDRALSALLADLDVRGLLAETLVVVATEFGRTPQIREGRNGRDHFPKAFSCLLAGGGIRGGQRWGRTDADGNEILENKVTVQDFNATVAKALGLPLDHIVYSPSGRPFTVAHKGQPVHGLFA